MFDRKIISSERKKVYYSKEINGKHNGVCERKQFKTSPTDFKCLTTGTGELKIPSTSVVK